MKKPRPNPRAARRASPARAAAARANGKRGGRKKARLPDDLVARLGLPPSEPLELARWYQRMLAEVTYLLATGSIDSRLAHELRAQVNTSARAVPLDVIATADRRLRDSDKKMRAREGGAPLEEVPSHGEQPSRAVRCAPR